MTEELAAIKATYHHWRPVKGGGVLRLEFDVKLEDQERVLRYLGPPGLPGETKWVAIALLADQPAEVVPIGKARKRPETEGERAVMRAGILCRDTGFQFWVSSLYPEYKADETIEDFVRNFCHIQSRAELASNTEALAKFYELDTAFREWAGRR